MHTLYLCLVYICGAPYVCLDIILLSTATITDVPKIAHRERVPNGTLPKLGRVLTPLWERQHRRPRRRRLRWRCASLFHQLLQHHVNMLLPEYVLFDRRYTAKNYWLSKIYTQNIIVHLLQVVPEVTLCAWTHTVFIIVCLVTNIWNCSPATTWFLKYRHILHWRRHMEQWSVIYDHHLRQLLPSSSSTTATSTSIYNYIGHYISAVGLDSLRFEQCRFCCKHSRIALRSMFTVRWQLCNLHRFLMLPTTDACQTLPLIYIHSWSTFIVLLYVRSCALHRAVIALRALHRGNARESLSTLRNILTFNLNCIVVF